jgi:hypothetical protein
MSHIAHLWRKLIGTLKLTPGLKDWNGRTPLSAAISGGHRAVERFCLRRFMANEIYVNDAILKQESNHKTSLQCQPGQPHCTLKKLEGHVRWRPWEDIPCSYNPSRSLLIFCWIGTVTQKFVMHFCGLLKCGVLFLFDLPLFIPSFCEELINNNAACSWGWRGSRRRHH